MKKLLIIGIIAAICTACGGGASSVDKAISQVEKSIAKLEKNKGKVTEEEWKALEKEVEEPMKVLADALESDKVGAMSKLKIVALTAKWATVVMEAGFGEMQKQLGTELENFGEKLEDAVKDIEGVDTQQTDSEESPASEPAKEE